MKKIIITILLGLSLVSCGEVEDSNARLEYGSSGLPSNCRALITENIKGYNNGDFSAEIALNSINRNCGEYGSEWKNSIAPTRYVNPYEWTLEIPKGEMERKCEEEKEEIRAQIEDLQGQIDNSTNESTYSESVYYNNTKNKSKELTPHYGKVTGNTNLRKEAGLDGLKIKVLKKGDMVTYWPETLIYKDGYKWLIVGDNKGNTGWAVIDGLLSN